MPLEDVRKATIDAWAAHRSCDPRKIHSFLYGIVPSIAGLDAPPEALCEALLACAASLPYSWVRDDRELVQAVLMQAPAVSVRALLWHAEIRAKLDATEFGIPLPYLTWWSLFSTLEAAEKLFCSLVLHHPGCKLSGMMPPVADDPMYTSGVWTRPENLGLVVAVGSYKWRALLQPLPFQEAQHDR
jgi:hypothetical protein